MAYSELPWRPFLGHKAWCWTTLRRVNVFLLRLQTFVYFCHVFTFFNVFKIYIWTFLHLWCEQALVRWWRCALCYRRVADGGARSRRRYRGRRPSTLPHLTLLAQVHFTFSLLADHVLATKVIKSVVSVRPPVCLLRTCLLNQFTFELDFWQVRAGVITITQQRLKIKVIGQGLGLSMGGNAVDLTSIEHSLCSLASLFLSPQSTNRCEQSNSGVFYWQKIGRLFRVDVWDGVA